MGGSGGGYTFSRSTPAELSKQIREAELKAAEAEFSPVLTERLNELLATINTRDVDKISERLEAAEAILEDEIEDKFDLRFGGSVAKHTYVDGLSDVDTLLVMKTEGRKPRPKDVLNQISKELQDALPTTVTVSRGRIAVTLTYSDGEEIQIIPAIRDKNRLHVPSWRVDGWSKINPNKFTEGLTKRNAECGGKLVPTIKLAKAVLANFPEEGQLTGYHVESLAISAFRGYKGPYSVEKMLPIFFKKSSELVRAPIKDSSGQSVHVDAYLGRINSADRQQASNLLGRTARRMENATAARSIERWNEIIEENEL